MDHSLQVKLIDELILRLTEARSSSSNAIYRRPTAVYTDPERLQRERALFRARPLFMGFSKQLPEPWSYMTHDHSGVPLVLVRGEDGEVRAFRNVCSHRNARLVNDRGSLKQGCFVCPYHRWSYSDRGELVGVTSKRGFRALSLCDHGLLQLPLVERHGMIWASPNPGTPIVLDELLAGLGAELGNFGFEDYHLFRSETQRHALNWKLVIDTFLEPYHFGHIHTRTLARVFVSDFYLVHEYGDHHRFVLVKPSITGLAEQPKHSWRLLEHGMLMYILFPNTIMFVLDGHVEFWRVYPDASDPGACTLSFDLYTKDPVATDEDEEGWQGIWDFSMRTVVGEDFPVARQVQRNMGHGRNPHVLFGCNEPALGSFAERLDAALELMSS